MNLDPETPDIVQHRVGQVSGRQRPADGRSELLPSLYRLRENAQQAPGEPGKNQRSKKEAVNVDLPILPILQQTIDSAKDKGETTFLVTEFGKPFTVAGLGNKMRQWCDEANLYDCTLHGLRKAGASIVAENGATDETLWRFSAG